MNIDDKLNSIEEKLDRLEKKLFFGNGEIPLCQQIHDNKKDIKYLKYKNTKLFNIFIGVAVILNTVAVIYFNLPK